MMDKLTTDNLRTLQRPFSKRDYEFTRGFCYLTEEAITGRIEEVDPNWTFEIMAIDHLNNEATVRARLTIKDTFRDGVGMQKLNEKVGDTDKGAATDALKRAARLFGIGRHLLDAPQEGPQFDKWLADLQRDYGILPPKPTVTSANGAQGPATSAQPATVQEGASTSVS